VAALRAIVPKDFAARDAAVARARVRRAKCRLLTGDVGQLAIAEHELRELPSISGMAALELYNAACAFAVAMVTPDLPTADRGLYKLHAWRLLGRALIVGGRDAPWQLTMTDPELAALDMGLRARYCDALKRRLASIGDGDPEVTEKNATASEQTKVPSKADAWVEECLAEIGVTAQE
jgi:hypothetical protein